MRFKSILLAIIFLFISVHVSAQYYETGQDPASLKWMQIKTGRFNIIYPAKYGDQGIKFAHEFERASSDLGALFPERKFRIPVIIHNFTTISNGYVSWAPRRIELYPTPEQNSFYAIPMDPDRQLALHELTHVMQMESLYSGFSKIMSYAMGEQFPGIIAGLQVPLWYMEGDAVYAETVLSQSGRGRTAGFQKQLKALAIEKDHLYSYDKMLNGSFKDLTPDHYQFGYQMVAWSFANNDLQLWNKALKYTGDLPITFNPVNISLKKNAGLTKKQLYSQTFDTLKALWKEDIERSAAIRYTPLNPDKKKKYIGYFSPIFVSKDSVIAIKSSMSEPAEFVLIKPSNKSEKKLHVPGMLNDLFLSYSMGKLVWVETKGDPRWENRQYSVIKLKNIKTGSTRQLSRRTRFMGASISPDGKQIAAIENTAENKNNLVLLDVRYNRQKQSFPVPENASLQRPQWSGDGRKITFISLTKDGEGIISFDTGSHSWDVLLEPGRDDLQSSFLRNDSLFYITSASGTDNIFVLVPKRNQVKVTSSRFGANDLSINGSTIMFCDYTSSGNDICTISIKEIPEDAYILMKPVSYLIDRSDAAVRKSDVMPATQFSPKPYRKWQHLFTVHSWMPFYADIEKIQSDPLSVRPGVSVMSQNHLSTLVATAGYEYSTDRINLFHSRITWKGWYPVYETEFVYGGNPEIYKTYYNDPNPTVIHYGYQFINTLSVPLTFSSGRFSQYIYLAGIANYQNNFLYDEGASKYTIGTTRVTGRLYLKNYYNHALRDIYPKWAQVADLLYSYYPFEKDYFGSIFTVKTAFYFPGIFTDDGIRFRFEAEKQDPSKYYMGNRLSFSRSYENITSMQAQFYSIDYVKPVVYPDFNVGSFLYLKRIRTTIFYDYTEGKNNYVVKNDTTEYHNYKETFASFGADLIADFYFLRIPFMMSAGVEATLRSFHESPYFRFIFNIDIYGMSIGRKPRM
jgi:hypothetical protein